VQLVTGSKGCFEGQESLISEFFSVLGFPKLEVVSYSIAMALGIVPILILFVGSILTILLERKDDFFSRDSIEAWIRDVIVAPCAEELYFRAGVISFLYLNKVETKALIFLSPMLFGLSHVHHMYDNIVHCRLSVRHAAVVAMVQFAYTYVFGCLAAFLLLKTGNILAPISAHALCTRFGDIKGYKYSTVIAIAHICGVVGLGSVIAWMAWDSRLGYVSMNPMTC
jgi:membrane protease YdiL (CAAX protease family)